MTSLTVRLAITILLLGFVTFVLVEPRELLDALSQARGPELLLALVVTLADRVIMASKWQLLLVARGIRLPWLLAVRAYFASSFAGLFLPVTVGADAIRVLATRRFGVADVTASIIVERTLGALAVLTVGFIGWWFIAAAAIGADSRMVTVGIVATGLAIAVGFLASLYFAGSTAFARLPSAFSRLAAAYGAYRRHPLALTIFYAASMVEALVPGVVAYVIARGLGLDAPWWVFLTAIPVALTIARLPISLGGFGVQEVSFVYLAGLLGIAGSDALATMLVSDAVLLVALAPAALDVSMLNLRHEAVR